ncbi:MAG: NAD(P)H-dependent glycerol-3-phosphate dehydrogenase [Gammaproteobacteria bacterium]|nr:NAD(P)H-dependent glycerol-3-phosphate dehydrogenase [Gammaproteobacteria bacterium]
MKLSVAILGAGSWGTTFAVLASRNARVSLWSRDPRIAAQIHSGRANERYLPGIKLPPRLRADASLETVVAQADVIVMAVPSHGFRTVLGQLNHHLRPWVPVISLSKGLEQQTHLRMSQLVQELLPGHPVGVLSGPNLAGEILAGRAAASVLAMNDPAIVRQLQPLFSSGLFRVYTNTDIVGCELGGVLKNVIAIACGMGDGMGAGDNTRAAMITRGLAEITRLGVALGGSAETFAGLAGLGDLVATCTSPLSRNRHVGEQLGRGRSIGEILDEMSMVAEGVRSTPVALALAEAHGVAVPMIREVDRVLAGGSARQAFRALLKISAGAEADPG